MVKKGEGKEEKRKEGKRKIENVLKSSFLYICIEFNGVQITFTYLFSPCPFDGREDGLTSLGFSFFICKMVTAMVPSSQGCCEASGRSYSLRA